MNFVQMYIKVYGFGQKPILMRADFLSFFPNDAFFDSFGKNSNKHLTIIPKTSEICLFFRHFAGF